MNADDVEALADRFFAAVAAGHADTVAACYAPDAVVWHNFTGVEQPREENLRVLAWLARTFTERQYDEVRRIVVADGFVQQHVLRLTAADGRRLAVPAMLRVRCADGRITRIEEYLDPSPLRDGG